MEKTELIVMSLDNLEEEQPFSYIEGKQDLVQIAFHGRVVTTLKGKDAVKFLNRVVGADVRTAQLVMAKVTGNFKRGNEKANKR